MAQESASGTENLEVMAEAINYNAMLLELLRNALPETGLVLDFGAGQGTFSLPLHTAGPLAICCVEPNPIARAYLEANGMTTHESAAALPRNSLDGAYSLNVLEHIPDDGKALRQIFTCLKPGAPLFLYVPAFQCLYSPMDERVGHLRRYRKGALASLVKASGFTVTRTAYIDSLGFAASLAYRWFGRSDGKIDRNALRLYDRYAFPVSRALDRITHGVVGKNIALWAYRPS